VTRDSCLSFSVEVVQPHIVGVAGQSCGSERVL